MDPFEVRMQFLTLLRRLNASQQSIQKVVSFALKYFPRCGEDIWDCVVEECGKGTVNDRINILYFLDSLCESSLLAKSHPATSAFQATQEGGNSSFYVPFVARDLQKIVESVVPEGRHGLPNLMSTIQILENWRTKRIIDPQKVEEIVASLEARKVAQTPAAAPVPSLSRPEIVKRIEEDRERHKRLRERRWVQPISHHPHAAMLPPPLASFLPLDEHDEGWRPNEELTLDIEFENEWETTSDWNEDDDEAVSEETELCFPDQKEWPRPTDGEKAMDLG
ncbi:hypothetical protein PUNSTDRAFT_72264 [Punctularia strigosozonata HHB-11173 SS5]|uniref:uncharacterized protein n=1 Tax=Punctularia strigosozonata (strain HHB-11173) TaxID=741275 RepID=UPI000441706F|nr:uncharacterized protein PUNSTDRAFT_72264 [Punctularia strigosozonata HHB-11173 SS5]EIN06627.1 hypothetical protein PUNSTDRAFT_72264 [Punctularia strigosozonata HHB-11173 SS5]